MAVFKLHLEDFDEVNYQLIAIHTSLEDYRLAYFLNQRLPIVLTKNKEQISVHYKETEVEFAKFVFDNQLNNEVWTLIQNKNEFITFNESTGQNLFLDTTVEIETKVYLLPEFKKVDYFLKVENTESRFNLKEVINTINTIQKISAVYAIEIETIKSKNNLIF